MRRYCCFLDDFMTTAGRQEGQNQLMAAAPPVRVVVGRIDSELPTSY
jgi:hypothetical protein